MPDFTDLPPFWDEGAEYVAVHPDVLLGAQRDHAFAILLDPQGTDRTVDRVHLFHARPDTDADADLRLRNAAQWNAVFEEDIFVVEGMQRGRHAPGFDGGRFGPAMDVPRHTFHAWIAGKLGAG